jgi:hypothetical protein
MSGFSQLYSAEGGEEALGFLSGERVFYGFAVAPEINGVEDSE